MSEQSYRMLEIGERASKYKGDQVLIAGHWFPVDVRDGDIVRSEAHFRRPILTNCGKWIRFTDELPKAGIEVAIRTSGGSLNAVSVGGDFQGQRLKDLNWDHWMELPPRPGPPPIKVKDHVVEFDHAKKVLHVGCTKDIPFAVVEQIAAQIKEKA